MVQKQLKKLPNEIWLVELDSGNIVPPVGSNITDVTNLPDPECTILRYHLKQVLNSIAIQPIKNFDDISAESLARMTRSMSVDSYPPPGAFTQPFIFGNDVDSIDVATRVAMVCTMRLQSLNLLRTF